MNLYKVQIGILNEDVHYVVAENPDVAYQKVRNMYDSKKWGFPGDRVLRSITLLAETGDYPECKRRLYL